MEVKPDYALNFFFFSALLLTFFLKHIASVVPFPLYNPSDKINPNWKNQENFELSKYIIVF